MLQAIEALVCQESKRKSERPYNEQQKTVRCSQIRVKLINLLVIAYVY